MIFFLIFFIAVSIDVGIVFECDVLWFFLFVVGGG